MMDDMRLCVAPEPMARVACLAWMTRVMAAIVFIIAMAGCADDGRQTRPTPVNMPLTSWKIESSSNIAADGSSISTSGFDDADWLAATVPGTVFGAQLDAGVFVDPFFAMNLTMLPGWTYSFLPMPEDSPYRQPWWWRTEFDIPQTDLTGARTYLILEGINYSANLWVNGRKVSDRAETVGTFREFRLDITGIARPGERCAVAVEVFVPDIMNDLSIYWVDWNPEPPDYNMGIWMPVEVRMGGPVSVRNPAVLTDIQDDGSAELTLIAELGNDDQIAHDVIFRAEFDGRLIEHPTRLDAGEIREIILTSADTPALTMKEPVLWWPYNYGSPHLYEIALSALIGQEVSDSAAFQFGVREVTAEIAAPGSIKYSINGRPILIRGAGWAPDMAGRFDPERDKAELALVKDLGLNALRLEGKLEDHGFYDLCDREGILLMPGWCCCDTWEAWDVWNDQHYEIARRSLENQLRRLRRHASVFTWLNGSDFHPPPDVENMYLTVADQARWNLPIVSNATETPSTVSGPSGMKMTGPYHWVPPNYWYIAVPADPDALADQVDWPWLYGGAFGFNSESSPGPAVPPLDSLLRFLPIEDVWPTREPFLFHSGGTSTASGRMKVFNNALIDRLGTPADAADYAFKAQVMAYESHRAAFEAQGRNKYFATGFIQWMLNNAWPGTIWHLYDYYLRPAGSYFGAKTALRPVHVQYSYDDHTIWLVNSTLAEFNDLVATATIYDVESNVVAHLESPATRLTGDGNIRVLDLADELARKSQDLSPVFFLDLRLFGSGGSEIDHNFYWLSPVGDRFELAYNDREMPDVDVADMTALADIPRTRIDAPTFELSRHDDRVTISQKVTNPGNAIAFFLEILLRDADSGDTILPVAYSDNYFSLVPGETRAVTISVPTSSVEGRNLKVATTGWNIEHGSDPGP